MRVLDDDVEDSGETFKLVLHNPQGAAIEDGVGIGTILNKEDYGAEVQLTAAFELAPAQHSGRDDVLVRPALQRSAGPDRERPDGGLVHRDGRQHQARVEGRSRACGG